VGERKQSLLVLEPLCRLGDYAARRRRDYVKRWAPSFPAEGFGLPVQGQIGGDAPIRPDPQDCHGSPMLLDSTKIPCNSNRGSPVPVSMEQIVPSTSVEASSTEKGMRFVQGSLTRPWRMSASGEG
jgi:hypothetical protein